MTDKETNEDVRFVDKRSAARAGAGGAGDGRDEDETPGVAATGDEVPGGGDVGELREKADQYYKNWQRATADYLNFKKRVDQDRSESARLAQAALVINLLPVFDDLDRAVSNVDAGLAGLNWVQGVAAIHQKFARLLEAMNVHEVEATDAQFDPSRHEAIGQAPGPEGKVLQVVQKGYTLGDRVIRPAMVIVGDGSG
ncbi:MAG: nucleotide exchange factor GrpE [Dehalococcoidia bacterium]